MSLYDCRDLNVKDLMQTVVFDRYLNTVAATECDLLTHWREHVDAYPYCAAISAIAGHFLVIPVSSAASKHLLSVTNKHRSCLLPERVVRVSHFRIEISN